MNSPRKCKPIQLKREKRRLIRRRIVFIAAISLVILGFTQNVSALPLNLPQQQLPGPWWDPDWSYVQIISITTGSNSPANGYNGYSTLIILDTTDGSRFRGDCNDLRIVYWNGVSNIELDRDLYNCGSPTTEVWFQLQMDIPPSSTDSDYFLYYGNPFAGSAPSVRSNVYLWWDDFSTDPFAVPTPRYSRTKAVDIHGSVYAPPSYDAANQRVVFDTGDNITSDMYINSASLSNGEQDVLIQVDHFGDRSYPTNATDTIVARVSALNTSSSHEYLHISHGSYPFLLVHLPTRRERHTSVQYTPS